MQLRMFNKIFLRKTISFPKISNNYRTSAQEAIQLKGWKSVVGLEVHAQISSLSKLFSESTTAFDTPLNSGVAYFDAAIPGTLPILNRKCVEAGVKTALALGCQVNPISMFDRKHYFYADLPCGYQITQQRAALANHGEITFPVIVPGRKIYYKTARLLQLQLEQDSGKSIHDEELQRTLIDLNRAGLPLMELVFAPDLETGDEAASLVKELVLILRRLGTCSCKMEEGALRVDANVSVHKTAEPLGIRTEIKNIGSVRAISQAITYEIQRQLNVVGEGGEVTNETRSWDAVERRTLAMRDKETQEDYRCMPEPNLPPLHLNMSTEDSLSSDLVSVPLLAATLPELPEQTRRNLIDTYQIPHETAIILVNEPKLLEYFLNINKLSKHLPVKMMTNFLINDFLMFCHKANINIDQCSITSKQLKDILQALHDREINLHAATHLLELLLINSNAEIKELIKSNDLLQITDEKQIEILCQQAIERQTKAVKSYQNGKTKALFAIVGDVAKLSSDKADMRTVVTCLERLLKKN